MHDMWMLSAFASLIAHVLAIHIDDFIVFDSVVCWPLAVCQDATCE